jgi:hypothetical protein
VVENSCKIVDGRLEGKRPTLIMKDSIKRELKELALDIRTACSEPGIGASDRLLCAR